MVIEINLFEFVKYSWKDSQELAVVSGDPDFSDNLEKVLEKIWADRNKYIPSEKLFYKSSFKDQQFISFRKNEIIPRNWTGTIHFRSNGQEYVVNLLPKLFYRQGTTPGKEHTESIFAHILWWLSVIDKQYYSSQETSAGAMQSGLLEILIYLFAAYTLDVFSVGTYNYYQTLEKETSSVKGSVDFGSYSRNWATGNRHLIPCVFDSFQYDNQFNRIVKYVCTVLRDIVKNMETRSMLDDLLFILDEVEYTPAVAEDCDKVVMNPVFSEYRTILDNCRMFLSSLSVFKWKDEYEVFALLIPTEKLFENFIFSVLKKNSTFPVKHVGTGRPGRIFLAKQYPGNVDRFKMKNDIVVKLEGDSYILLDAKYKRVTDWFSAKNQEITDESSTGIKQADIYQMVSYSVSSGVADIALIYPGWIDQPVISEYPIWEIFDEFTENIKIRIHVFIAEIIHEDGIDLNVKGKLDDVFKRTESELVNQLNEFIKKVSQAFNP